MQIEVPNDFEFEPFAAMLNEHGYKLQMGRRGWELSRPGRAVASRCACGQPATVLFDMVGLCSECYLRRTSP